MTQKERNRCVEEQKKMLFATAKYITQKDYKNAIAIATTVAAKVPKGWCRIKREAYESALIDAIKAEKSRTPGKPIALLTVGREDLSGRLAPYPIDVLYCDKIDSIDFLPRTVYGYKRLPYANVIAIIKA